jgi:hypothetical protein
VIFEKKITKYGKKKNGEFGNILLKHVFTSRCTPPLDPPMVKVNYWLQVFYVL